MPKVTCTVYSKDSEYIAQRTGHAKNGSEVVSRNNALMKVANDDGIDWDDRYEIECE